MTPGGSDDAALGRQMVATACRDIYRARVRQIAGEDEVEIGGVRAAARRRVVDVDGSVGRKDGARGGCEYRFDECQGHLRVGERGERVGRSRRAFERREGRLGRGCAGEG